LPRQNKDHTEDQPDERVKHQHDLHREISLEKFDLRVIDVEKLQHLPVRGDSSYHLLHVRLIL
jgi:hypothetical protein